jgi:transposase
VGLALLVTADGEVPLLHQTYPGNQHDAPTFGSVIDELRERCRRLGEGTCDITVIFDKGNNSEDNLEELKDPSIHFVGSLVPTHHPDLLAIPRDQMERLDRRQLPAVWAYRTRREVFGVERTVLVTFNQPLFRAQERTLKREIRKRERRLEKIQRSLQAYVRRPRGRQPTVEGVKKRVEALLQARHMKDLFRVRISKGRRGLPGLRWTFRQKGWDHLTQTLLGKTILFTDREAWTDEQIVKGYRSQAHVELAFRRMKDPRFLTFRPTHHWTDQKLRVHASYCVLALMLASLLRRQLAKAGLDLSIAEMMRSLTDIQEVALLYRTAEGLPEFKRLTLSQLDKTQRKLVDILDLRRYCQK